MSKINLSNFETGDSSFQDLYVYGKLNYNFDNDDITVKSINVTSPSTFSSDVTFTGDITLDEITCRNANVTGIATVGTSLYVQGKLFDGDGDFGTAGQLLSSDGTDTVWIDANTTSVANSINVGTNADATNAEQFVTFVGASSGNNPIRVDAGIKYNPAENRLTAGSYAGDGSALTGIFMAGMIILWSGAADAIPSGFVLCDGNNSTPDLRNRFVIGAGSDYAVNATGGSANATLPSHYHNFPGDDQLGVANGVAGWNNGSDGTFFYDAISNTASNTGTMWRTSTEGSSATNANLPPYYALCYIMKT